MQLAFCLLMKVIDPTTMGLQENPQADVYRPVYHTIISTATWVCTQGLYSNSVHTVGCNYRLSVVRFCAQHG